MSDDPQSTGSADQQDNADVVQTINEFVAADPESMYIEGLGQVPVSYVQAEPRRPLPVVRIDDIVSPSSGVVWSAIGEEVVVHQLVPPVTHALSPTAALLWQCLDGSSSLRDILTDFADAFAVPLDALAGDCLPIVAEWERDGLVGESDPVLGSTPIVGSSWRRLADPPND